MRFVNYMGLLTVRNRSTRRCYDAVLNAATTGKVLLFTSDDTTVMRGKGLVTIDCGWFNTPDTDNIFFCPPHTLVDLLVRINIMKPVLVVINCHLGFVGLEELAEIAEHTQTEFLVFL